MIKNASPRLRLALVVIVLMGTVSLFGDIVYEGARSVTGPYLLVMGASAFTVSVVAGLGEFLGYGIRLISGYFADRTRNYWVFTITGYLMIGAIPLLVFAGSWETAAFLLIVERIGKGIRSPSKDAILSHAAKECGRGFGFGIHEAMDQIGAVLGPLLFSGALLLYGEYQPGFALMSLPFLLLVVALVVAWRKIPDPQQLEEHDDTQQTDLFPGIMVPYSLFTAFVMAGFFVFPLLAFHFKQLSIVPDAQIPFFYAIAMGVDAVVALIIGKAYDRRGIGVLFLLPILGACVPVLAFSFGYPGALLGTILWGAAMGVQETVLRAAVADYTHISKRGTAYGILNTVYGAAWFAGSVTMGMLYEFNISLLIAFVAIMQAGGFVIFHHLMRRMR
ncbi:MAG TPA: MFS transporter [Methanoregulaceae archaeon]|nr:MFS transporter [Methanolinea sp.]MDD3090583.1 MFS transporter [Methanoregulaceae archaeon]MDD5684344.1 MFS transporter [Methanoregulaceae archaeon]HOP66704.1 MFS transporter [Methanoregulaceae archaeon]HPJ74013.1 MFS transporter [Methanoregulaceae archaeon]